MLGSHSYLSVHGEYPSTASAVNTTKEKPKNHSAFERRRKYRRLFTHLLQSPSFPARNVISWKMQISLGVALMSSWFSHGLPCRNVKGNGVVDAPPSIRS